MLSLSNIESFGSFDPISTNGDRFFFQLTGNNISLVRKEEIQWYRFKRFQAFFGFGPLLTRKINRAFTNLNHDSQVRVMQQVGHLLSEQHT